MRKIRCSFLVLSASFILAVQLYGQDSQSDSIKLNSDSAKNELNLSSDIVKKLDNKDIVEIIKYREKLAQEKEMANDIANPPSYGNKIIMETNLYKPLVCSHFFSLKFA